MCSFSLLCDNHLGNPMKNHEQSAKEEKKNQLKTIKITTKIHKNHTVLSMARTKCSIHLLTWQVDKFVIAHQLSICNYHKQRALNNYLMGRRVSTPIYRMERTICNKRKVAGWLKRKSVNASATWLKLNEASTVSRKDFVCLQTLQLDTERLI